MFVYRGIYFGFYDTIKGIISDDIKNNMFINFSIGCLVTMIA